MPLSSSRKFAIVVSLVWVVIAYSNAYDLAEEITGNGKSYRRYFDVPEFILYLLRNNLPLIAYWGCIWVTGKNIFAWVLDKAKRILLKITGLASQNKNRIERSEHQRNELIQLIFSFGAFGVLAGLSAVMPMIWSGLKEEEVWDEAIICLISEIHMNQDPHMIMQKCDKQLAVLGWDEAARSTLYTREPRELFKEMNIEPYK